MRRIGIAALVALAAIATASKAMAPQANIEPIRP